MSPRGRTRYLSLCGAGCALVGFVMPYLESPSLLGRHIGLSGLQIANAVATLWLIPAMAAAIVLTCVRAWSPQVRQGDADVFCAIVALLGIGALLGIVPDLRQQHVIFNISAADLGATLGMGVYVSILGFALVPIDGMAGLAVQLAPPARDDGGGAVTHRDPPPDAPVVVRPLVSDATAERIVAGTQTVSRSVGRSAARAASAARDTLLRRRPLVIGAALALVVVASAAYVFARPNPERDGRRAARGFLSCDNEFGQRLHDAADAFSKASARPQRPRRLDAQHALDAALVPARQAYDQCVAAASQRYATLFAKSQMHPDRVGEFVVGFDAGGGRGEARDAIERGSPAYRTALAFVHGLHDAFPDSGRIVADLVGKQMDSWNFAFASEFAGVHVVRAPLVGDSLLLRTALDLRDYRTGEPWYALVDLVYSSDSVGAWRFQDLRELVLSEGQMTYRAGTTPFIIGRWRLVPQDTRGMSAEFAEDGTWQGGDDEGGHHTGRWRIVRDNLTLTDTDQSTLLSTRITSFTPRTFELGDATPPIHAERVGAVPAALASLSGGAGAGVASALATQILGKWVQTNAEEDVMSFEFFPNGRAHSDDVGGSVSTDYRFIAADRIMLGGLTCPCTVRIAGDAMTLITPDGMHIEFARQTP